jgi:hypothetical protein
LKIQDKLYDQLKSGESDLMVLADKEQLESLGTLLTENVNVLAGSTDTKPLKEISCLAAYLSDDRNAFAAKVVGRLQVHHYGSLMKFVRQTIGM